MWCCNFSSASEMCFLASAKANRIHFPPASTIVVALWTATLTISFLLLCFYRQGAGPDLCYRYLHLQFRCNVVTYQT